MMKIITVEEHGDILPIWKGLGYKNETVVVLDRHLDLKRINSKRMKIAKNWYDGKIKTAPVRELPLQDDLNYAWGIDDFLWTAFQLGVVSEVIWIYPSKKSIDELLSVLKKNIDLIPNSGLLRYKVCRQLDYASAYFKFGKVTICNIDSILCKKLPSNAKYDIDLDYFISSTGGLIHKVDDVIELLSESRTDITLTYSISSGFTPEEFRYLARDIAEKLKSRLLSKNLERRNFPLSASVMNNMAHVPRDKIDLIEKTEMYEMGGAGYNLVSLLYLEKGEINQSRKFIEMSEESGSLALIPNYKLGLYYMKTQQYELAATCFDKISRKNIEDSIQVHAVKLLYMCLLRVGSDFFETCSVEQRRCFVSTGFEIRCAG